MTSTTLVQSTQSIGPEFLAQQTYYFYSFFQLQKQVEGKVRFVVPSGNFGDILAGYYAYKMGLPADKLIIATNENDILIGL